MGNFSPIRSIIDRAINLDLANPNLSISTKEALLKEDAITLGCLDYYRSFPMRITMQTAYNSGTTGMTTFNWAGLVAPTMVDGNMVIPFDDVFSRGTPKVPTEQMDHAHFLGVMRVERPAWNTYSNPSMWNKQLLGIQVDNTQFDIMKTILSNTLDDLSTGQPRYNINRMQNRIEVQLPWGFGQLSWDFAIGFDSPEYVEMTKVDFLCKFISLRFIESIIQARDGVKLDADFEISTEALQKRLEKLRDEVDSIKNHSVLHLAQWN